LRSLDGAVVALCNNLLLGAGVMFSIYHGEIATFRNLRLNASNCLELQYAATVFSSI